MQNGWCKSLPHFLSHFTARSLWMHRAAILGERQRLAVIRLEARHSGLVSRIRGRREHERRLQDAARPAEQVISGRKTLLDDVDTKVRNTLRSATRKSGVFDDVLKR